MIVIRGYQPQDSKALAKIFENAILAIDDSVYSSEQKHAWLGSRSDEFWQSRFEQTKPFVALINNEPVGFIEFGFDNGFGEIDCFYVEPKFQDKGIGQTLFDKVLSVAKENNINQIHVNASHVAKPFFEKQGFQTIQKDMVERSGIILENWFMSYH